MIVSTRGRYALRVMIDIAEHPNEPYIPLKSIAARQGISEKYLESILKILVQEHILEGLLFLPYGAFAKLCICTLKYYTFSNRI